MKLARYFRFFANFALRRWHPRVIAVTGPAGKTTMLHMIEFELGDRAHYSHESSSAASIALDLLGLGNTRGSIFLAPIRALYYRRSEEFYVVAISGDPREADSLTTWLKPEITLNLDPDSPEMTTVPKTAKSSKSSKAKTIKFDKKKLKRYNVYPTRTDFIFESASFHFAQPQPRDLAIQLLMLEALVDYLGVPLRTDFSGMPVPPGRSSYFQGKKGLNIIDSSYSSELMSAEAILEMARGLRAGHKWLVIGDLFSPKNISQNPADQDAEDHRKLANLIADTGPEMVILVGPRVKEYTAPRLRELGVPARTTLDPKKALTFIEQNATGEETLIFKGGEHLEWVIENLLENPKDAESLPRRTPTDIKNRKKAGLK